MALRIDLPTLLDDLDVDWAAARASLAALYEEVDERIGVRTSELDLPCHRGCSMCCHESVFITPLEFLFVWEHVQSSQSDDDLAATIERGLTLYELHESTIVALDEQPAEAHGDIARRLKFACPLLAADGGCSVYPVRELYARLFGCSFNDAGGIYGCHLVGAHLADKIVTLPRAKSWAERLNELPLTFKRQVYPYWINWLYRS